MGALNQQECLLLNVLSHRVVGVDASVHGDINTWLQDLNRGDGIPYKAVVATTTTTVTAALHLPIFLSIASLALWLATERGPYLSSQRP